MVMTFRNKKGVFAAAFFAINTSLHDYLRKKGQIIFSSPSTQGRLQLDAGQGNPRRLLHSGRRLPCGRYGIFQYVFADKKISSFLWLKKYSG
jgi:hypothetical protein